MTLRLLLLSVLVAIQCSNVFSQNDPKWDDTRSKDWPVQAKKVGIPSTADGKEQLAYFFASPAPGPRPLIISLHTWSSNYQQKDTVINLCIKKGYNYIHPDFRGGNTRPEACGSDLVISDIDDAISWAMANTNTDPENIHVIGVSGGGYATVLTYMRSKHKIRSFSAWAGLYNLIDWYEESVGRKARYAGDVAASTTGNREVFDMEEGKKRSPFYMNKTVTDRSNSSLSLYCGIHDGYTGSVPITHSLNFYNKLVTDINPDARLSTIPVEYIHTMVRARSLPGGGNQGTLLGRKIIYTNHYRDQVRITVFEGGHEMLPGDVLDHVPSRTILAIGDSNGALDYGWANQLKGLREGDRIINTCISGNTIGFDNQNKKELNALKNVDQVFGKVPGRTDAVVVMLGTNDCKAVFAGQIKDVPGNLDKLIKQIKARAKDNAKPVPVFIVSPPPHGEDNAVAEKYKGGARRVEYLVSEFKKVSDKNQCHFIDTHSKIKAAYRYLTSDGIHLTKEGQAIIAAIIDDEMSRVLQGD